VQKLFVPLEEMWAVSWEMLALGTSFWSASCSADEKAA
jgi:hypothetical protein